MRLRDPNGELVSGALSSLSLVLVLSPKPDPKGMSFRSVLRLASGTGGVELCESSLVVLNTPGDPKGLVEESESLVSRRRVPGRPGVELLAWPSPWVWDTEDFLPLRPPVIGPSFGFCGGGFKGELTEVENIWGIVR